MTTKELLNLIKTRRSVRIFTGKKVSDKVIEILLEAAIWAPTGCNNQELRFLVLDKPKDIKQILRFKPFFQGVSHFILVFYDLSLPRSKRLYRQSWVGRHLPDIDAGLVLANMALVAKSLGLDTCVFNLSPRHFAKPNQANLFTKIIRWLRIKLNFGLNQMENNFEYVLRRSFKIPAHLEILAAMAVGFGQFVPDPKKVYHGGDLLQRKPLAHYLIKK